jgi:hypothetical protein
MGSPIGKWFQSSKGNYGLSRIGLGRAFFRKTDRQV